MQSHTHEDIDQSFVAIETHIKLATYNTLEEILNNFSTIYEDANTRPNNNIIQLCFAWTEFFKNNVADLYYYTEPHAFKFKKHEDGKVLKLQLAY